MNPMSVIASQVLPLSVMRNRDFLTILKNSFILNDNKYYKLCIRSFLFTTVDVFYYYAKNNDA